MKKLKQSVKLPLLIAGIILTAALIILIINLADSPKIADQTAEEQSEPQKTEISLLAVGDDLIH